MLQKINISFFKDHINVNNNSIEKDESDKDESDKRKITKMFYAILKDIKSNGRTTKPISVKSDGGNINLHPLIIKLLNARKMVLKKNYRFHEVFNIFDELDINHNKRNEYKLRTSDMINRKK